MGGRCGGWSASGGWGAEKDTGGAQAALERQVFKVTGGRGGRLGQEAA